MRSPTPSPRVPSRPGPRAGWVGEALLREMLARGPEVRVPAPCYHHSLGPREGPRHNHRAVCSVRIGTTHTCARFVRGGLFPWVLTRPRCLPFNQERLGVPGTSLGTGDTGVGTAALRKTAESSPPWDDRGVGGTKASLSFFFR